MGRAHKHALGRAAAALTSQICGLLQYLAFDDAAVLQKSGNAAFRDDHCLFAQKGTVDRMARFGKPDRFRRLRSRNGRFGSSRFSLFRKRLYDRRFSHRGWLQGGCCVLAKRAARGRGELFRHRRGRKPAKIERLDRAFDQRTGFAFGYLFGR